MQVFYAQDNLPVSNSVHSKETHDIILIALSGIAHTRNTSTYVCRLKDARGLGENEVLYPSKQPTNVCRVNPAALVQGILESNLCCCIHLNVWVCLPLLYTQMNWVCHIEWGRLRPKWSRQCWNHTALQR